MICYSCGCDNIAGVDLCEQCGQTLSDLSGAEEGQLGIFSRKLTDLTPRKPICVAPWTLLSMVIEALIEGDMGCVLVTGEGDELVGIFTERDVLYRVAGLIELLDEVPVESVMTPRPTALRADLPISHALHLMGAHGFRHVPLVNDQNRPIGYISFRDVVRYMEEDFTNGSR